MNIRKLLPLLVLCAILPFGQLKAQATLVLMFQDGSQQSSLISSLRKLTFSDTGLILVYTDGTMQSYDRSTVKKLTFNGVTPVDKVTDDSKILIFPNPSSDFIQFRNVSDGPMKIAVYRLDGMQVYAALLASEDEKLDVSHLKKGLYLIRVNTKVFKFMKI